MKYVLVYSRTVNNKSIITYVKNFKFKYMNWAANGSISNADYFDLATAQYIKRNIKYTDLLIRPVNY